MNNVQRIYAEERRIESCDVDLQSRIRPQTLLAYMLNSAWNDTEGTPYGYRQLLDSHPHHKLEKRELRSMEISYIAEAVLGDEVAVFREEDGSSGLCSVRHSSDGKELCRARLVWDG